ncbi:MAG: DEAD/DEAH box helicase [Oligoflexales bacterium]|nr:DEAD/DEAH box helicase [Oligoflexales bacterium]
MTHFVPATDQLSPTIKKLMNTLSKNLLDYIYESIEETDWYEGLDIYQAGKISEYVKHDNLITAKINTSYDKKLEIRLKIHPDGKLIQWIECSCHKNRKTGQFCEHIVALIIFLDREKKEIIDKLDNKMPIKPVTIGKRQKKQPIITKPKPREAIQALIQASSIHSANFIGNGSSLRVRLEIKKGELSHFDLSLDEAAVFFMKNKKISNFSKELKTIKVYKTPIINGTRISLFEDEKIVAERLFAIGHTKKSAEKIRKNRDIDTYLFNTKDEIFLENKNSKPAKGLFEFIPLKSPEYFIGNEYIFIPKRGFWPLPEKVINSAWNELPLKKTFEGDKAAIFIASKFSEFHDCGPIWVDKNLTEQHPNAVLLMKSVNVHHYEKGWYYLDPRYKCGNIDISMVNLMKIYQQKHRTYLNSKNTWVKMPDLVREYEWNLDDSGNYLKVDNIGLLRIKAIMGDYDNFAGKKRLLSQIRNQTVFTSGKAIPSLIHTNLNLREYQKIGLQWMWWLHKNNLNGLLADEMGLGKTHQAMAILSLIQKENKNDTKFLVIAPTTVLDHWMDKINEFCPNLKPLKYHGIKRQYNLNLRDTSFTTLVTSYGILLRDIKTLSYHHWQCIILDEAHYVKNNETATYQGVCRLRGDTKFCLTGTPIENHLGELKSIFDFMLPGFLGSDEYFTKKFIKPIDNGNSSEIETHLQRLIHPFKLRRTKEQVLKDLPEKVEDIRHCGLSSEQVKLYKNVLTLKATPLIHQLKNLQKPIPYLHVFAILTLLKQICDHPALVTPGADFRNHESEKFDLMKELISEAIGSNHKIVIYSQYVKMIKIISEYLNDIKLSHVTLTGQTRARGAIISRFQNDPECKVFLGSLLAGSIGIDLTAASVVIHYDRWWNASKENQATDRVHRIGQNKNVQVLKLMAKGTLEEKINTLIISKKHLFDKFMNKDEEIFKNFSREQLIDLLEE